MSAKDRRKGKLTKDSVTLLPCFYFVESDGTLLLYNKHAENLRDSNRGLTLPRSIMTFGYNVLGIRCTVLPILASSVVSLYFLELTEMFKPVLSGYTCYDRSLSLPYVEPTREIVPFLMLLSLAFAGPTATIMIGEGILYCCLVKRGYVAGTELNINAAGCNFNSYIRRAVRFVGVHVFGLCATALVTDIIQLSTGYHTPYFLTVCKPNYTTLSTSCQENSFILQDICSGTDPSVINTGRKSFPSQHATLAAFAAVYVSMYFNATLTDSSRLLKPALVFSFVMSAIICGLTRITQYKNHAVDVYLGFLIGGGMAIYLGLYAVGNFQPGEELSSRPTQPREVQQPPTDQRQESVRHLSIKSNSNSNGNPPRPESLINRNQRNTSSLTNLKRATANVEVITPRVPMGKESMVTFNTLPRVHTSALEDPTRRNATMHATMDTNQSKQLLSQWKSKNDSCNLSLQVIETEVSHSLQGSMEMRCNSEPAGVGINGDHQGPASQYMKLATSTSSGIAGGTRVSMPSRPSSTQLVHIPEETQESDNMSPKNSSTRSKWLSMAEKSVACSQPRIMQVIAMSKQQGLLQGSPKSSSGSTVSCTGSIRYKTLTDQEPVNIVRVEAHPENNRSVVQGPTPNGDGSWKWNSQERVSPRQSYEINNLNRGSESSGSPKDGSQHLHHQAVTTIRVTPVEGAEGTSETLSIASSQDSTLRRKGNVILIPERGSSPDNTRTIFYKGTSQSQAFGR